MPEQLPPIAGQSKTDAEHLRILSILHFVFGGLGILGIGFLVLHYSIMSAVFLNPDMWKNQKAPAPPEFFLTIFKWVYLVLGVLFVVGGVLNVLSGFFIKKRTNRMFSMVIAAIDCLQFPLGTALGVFTLIALLRPSVRQLYGEA